MPPQFPTLDLQDQTSPNVYQANHTADNSRGLAVVAEAADQFGQSIDGMLRRAATVEGRDAAARDLTGGTVNIHPNELTTFGQAYREVARQGLGTQRRAAIAQSMGEAFAAHPDNPAELNTALEATRAGMGTTGFADLDAELQGDFALRRADYMTRAAQGAHENLIRQGVSDFTTQLETSANLLDQTARGATFDPAGSERVAAAWGSMVDGLARFGPREAFDVAGRHYDADPTRVGALSPDAITRAAQQSQTSARLSWFRGAVDQLPTSDQRNAFLASMRDRYAHGDPIFAGIDGQQAEQLFSTIQSAADHTESDERQVQARAGEHVRQQLQAFMWGGDVDFDALGQEARRSGDAGLEAQVSFFQNADPTTRGVLHTVAARQLGLYSSDGGGGAGGIVPVDPRGIPAPGQNAVADGIRQTALGLGASPQDADALVRMGQIESTLRTHTDNGQHRGVFQFDGPTWEHLGGGDIRSVADQTRNALRNMQEARTTLTEMLGRAPSYGEIYLYHQQGAGGGPALFRAAPTTNAIEAITPAYVRQYGPDRGPAIARTAILNNGGTVDMTAAEFRAVWTRRFATAGHGGAPDLIGTDATGAGDGGPNPAWAPPPGARPGSPVYMAWANAQAGFTTDPLDYVRGSESGHRPPLVTVPILVTTAPFGNGDVAAWGHALQQRQALGHTLEQRFGVPARMLTNGERDYYRSQMENDPTAAVHLATEATRALGGQGGLRFMQEVAQGSSSAQNAQTYVHIGLLAAGGSSAFAASAAQGLAIRAQGRDGTRLLSDRDKAELDAAFTPMRAAFSNIPQTLVSAENVAEAAWTSDRARGIAHPASYYAQGAVGGRDVGGHIFGGAASYNGVLTPIPGWLRADALPEAMQAIASSWYRSNVGPRYANGAPIPPGQITALRLIPLPNGRYRMVNSTGAAALSRSGRPLEFDLEGNRAFLLRQLGPQSVAR